MCISKDRKPLIMVGAREESKNRKLAKGIKHSELGINSNIYKEHLHRRGRSSPSGGNLCTIASISTSSNKSLSTSEFEAFFKDNEEGDASCIIQEKDYIRKSHNSKEGLYVVDLINQGSIVLITHSLINCSRNAPIWEN
ncbi:hypothetical protein C5167_011682 [Papaver somniferum]|uniref:Uncharacterized protein n=1 Tax=Papaver somniferum TaxID=3469 RepID=A0A4Y7K7L3_PAPSO|nr:hypothetical protein C5167_011682 [Papaver somniferum]